MSNLPPKQGLDNAAWVTITTKLSVPSLVVFCSNIEQVIRINPYLKIISWRRIDENNFQVDWENHSNELVEKTRTEFEVQQLENEICINYPTGIKNKTYFIIESTNDGSQLTIVDDYGNQDDASRVDKSLNTWAQALKKFFDYYKYLQHIPFAKKLISRFWVRLSPMARRISYILIVITAVEIIALFAFVLLF